MKTLRSFLQLPSAERLLLAKAALLLGTIGVGLWILPFRILRRLLATATNTSLGPRRADPSSSEKVVWAVEVASRRLPLASTCLMQALATQVLFVRRGRPARVHIGVVRSEEGKFEAHAWVESEGRAVIGGHALERYTPLTSY